MAEKAKRELSKHAENKWVILALMALAQFMVVLDVSIVNVALPSMAKDLHFAPSSLQWVVTAYALTFGGFLLLGGRAADLYGRRRIFIAAVSFFALMSLLCGLAATDTQVIIARAFQGLAGAFMSPAALSIVLTEFREGKERNTALGVWAAVAAGGAAFGVLLGGVLTQYLSWRWNFFVNVPVGIFVVLASMRLLPHHIGEENKKLKLDFPGAVLATTGLMALVYGLSEAPQRGWGSSRVIGFLIASAVLLVSFVINETRTDQPLLPLRLFKIRNVAGGNATALAIACTLFSMFFFMTLYVQTVLGYGPAKAGVSFLPVTLVIAITSGIVSNLVNKIGYKPFLVAGPIVLAIGLYTLSTTMKVGGNYWHNVFPGLALCAFGMGLSFISMTLAATSGVPRHFSGIASGILNTSQQVGGAIGLAILSAVFASTFKAQAAAGTALNYAKIDGYQAGLHVGVGLAIAAALVAALVVKNEKVKPDLAAAA
ncbi:MAG TPA: DHA2 family efflux MFS transporter permease subunit [Candidatus Binatia bacterium]|nr:DHA2 family efflux MFS transporter permease subunit [Candidatus Binatia bacterium]